MLLNRILLFFFFFLTDPATTEIYTLSLHDALPISVRDLRGDRGRISRDGRPRDPRLRSRHRRPAADRKSTRLNSSHPSISYAVFCLKKKSVVLLTESIDSHNRQHAESHLTKENIYL